MDDCISRQATLEPYKDLNDNDVIAVWLIRKNIEQQPSVTPTERAGHWIRHEGYGIDSYSVEYSCSECNEWVEEKSDFCPHCGVKMI